MMTPFSSLIWIATKRFTAIKNFHPSLLAYQQEVHLTRTSQVNFIVIDGYRQKTIDQALNLRSTFKKSQEIS